MGTQRNVLGGVLERCGDAPQTGFFRTGKCETGSGDEGAHVVCARLTQKFLEYTRSRGNDLSSPRPELGFPGLKPGDRWCLCALRWKEALEAAVAPPVVLAATHEAALRYISLEVLQQHAIDDQNRIQDPDPHL